MPRRKVDTSIGSDHDDRKRVNSSSSQEVAGPSRTPAIDQPRPNVIGRPVRRPSPNTARRMFEQQQRYNEGEEEEEPIPPVVRPRRQPVRRRNVNVRNDQRPTNPPTFKELVTQLGICEADMKLQSVDDVPLKEDVKWIVSSDEPALKFETLVKGRKIGTPATSVEIDAEHAFIKPELYSELINCKDLFRHLSQPEYRIVRGKGNMFEKVGKGPFYCRAAMKMANLDVILNHELTNPTRDGHPVLDLFYFADVCAGPGGFTEYILWRKKWEARGFGLTLKGALDFDLKNLRVETDTFEAFYGKSDTGDIYIPINVTGFIEHVLANTGNEGVHLMMADGGFSVTGTENMQELLSQHIILAQIYVALAIVRVGGHVVCKLFDAVTPFTVALIYFMYHSFESVTIHKPLTSRAANSERYLICIRKKAWDVTSPIMKYLKDCHEKMWIHKNSGNNEAILELVPVSVLTNCEDPFYDYLYDCNNRLAASQMETLKRMTAFALNKSLNNDQMQWKARDRAMKHWSIPDEIPKPAIMQQPQNGYMEITKRHPKSAIIRRPEIHLVPGNVNVFKSVYDWRVVPTIVRAKPVLQGFWMSLGGHSIFKYSEPNWENVSGAAKRHSFMMPSMTLVYGEWGYETPDREGPVENFTRVFHIIDAAMLGGVDLRNEHYTRRIAMCEKFAQALAIPGRVKIEAKPALRMEHMLVYMDKIGSRLWNGAPTRVCPLDMNNPDSGLIYPKGFLFLKITRDPWQIVLDHKFDQKMFFNPLSGERTHVAPPGAIADFFETMENRILWMWDEETHVKLHDAATSVRPDRVHTRTFMSLFDRMVMIRPDEVDEAKAKKSTVPAIQP